MDSQSSEFIVQLIFTDALTEPASTLIWSFSTCICVLGNGASPNFASNIKQIEVN